MLKKLESINEFFNREVSIGNNRSLRAIYRKTVPIFYRESLFFIYFIFFVILLVDKILQNHIIDIKNFLAEWGLHGFLFLFFVFLPFIFFFSISLFAVIKSTIPSRTKAGLLIGGVLLYTTIAFSSGEYVLINTLHDLLPSLSVGGFYVVALFDRLFSIVGLTLLIGAVISAFMSFQALIILSYLIYGLQKDEKAITERLSRLDIEVSGKLLVFEIIVVALIVGIGKFVMNYHWLINLSTSIVLFNFLTYGIQARRESASVIINHKHS